MTSRYVGGAHPFVGSLQAPVVRLWELGADGKLMAALVGLVSAAAGDVSILLMGVLLISSAGDWWLGRAAAVRRGDFDSAISGWGLKSKIAGIILVATLRLLEAVLTQAGVPDPHGILAVVAAAGLIHQDLDSIDRHRQTLGGRPIPLLTTVLAVGRRMAESLLPAGGHDDVKGPASNEESDR